MMNFLAENNFKIRQQFHIWIMTTQMCQKYGISRSNNRCFGNISCSWSLTMHWNALSTHNFLFSFLTVLAFLDTLIYSCIKDRKIVIQHTTKIGMLRTNILVAYSRLKIVNLKYSLPILCELPKFFLVSFETTIYLSELPIYFRAFI